MSQKRKNITMFPVFSRAWLFAAGAVPFLITCTGCESLVKRQEFEIFQSAANRRLDTMSSDMDVIKGATHENRQAIEVLQEQVQRLSEHVGGMDQTLNAKATSLETTFNKKLQDILEEVSKENERLIQEINKSRGAATSGAISSDSSASGSVNVYNKTTMDTGQEPDLSKGFYHVVESGESLSKIAARYQVSIDNIIKANGMDNPDSLYMGQKLFIPSPDTELQALN